MKAPDKVMIECTPGACLFTLVDEDGIALFAEKFIMNDKGELEQTREFIAPGIQDAANAAAIRKRIAQIAPGCFSLAQLLHVIEEEVEKKSFFGFS